MTAMDDIGEYSIECFPVNEVALWSIPWLLTEVELLDMSKDHGPLRIYFKNGHASRARDCPIRAHVMFERGQESGT